VQSERRKNEKWIAPLLVDWCGVMCCESSVLFQSPCVSRNDDRTVKYNVYISCIGDFMCTFKEPGKMQLLMMMIMIYLFCSKHAGLYR